MVKIFYTIMWILALPIYLAMTAMFLKACTEGSLDTSPCAMYIPYEGCIR